jgi:hypothetical protein
MSVPGGGRRAAPAGAQLVRRGDDRRLLPLSAWREIRLLSLLSVCG